MYKKLFQTSLIILGLLVSGTQKTLAVEKIDHPSTQTREFVKPPMPTPSANTYANFIAERTTRNCAIVRGILDLARSFNCGKESEPPCGEVNKNIHSGWDWLNENCASSEQPLR